MNICDCVKWSIAPITDCSWEAVQAMLPMVSEQRREQALQYKHAFGQYACLKSYLLLQDLLREHYDYVILDTPPVGLVSDTLAIARVADMTLMVCRADYSPKSNFKLINELKQDNKMPKISLVLNGVDLSKRKYGYYYGYGKYGKYGKYGHYGNYGLYGHYGNRPSQGGHSEK